ncbi:MAG: hypothetical protein L0Y72_08215 [Gemmataceae bacterium]|nr:hypothetical protein [Gemmataceae bacterium]MCI0739013.1 hypothetical protein [Gemmataceae bacterium]
MLQALDAQTATIVTGAAAQRTGRYLCPECGALVALRVGSRKTPHFAHFSRRLCWLAEPESPRHRALKWLCKKFFAPLPVEWEVRLGNRRVDVFVNRQFVVECQASPLAWREWQAPTADHNRHGYPVLWLWDVKRLCGKNTLAEAMELEGKGRAVWAAPEIRLCHEESRDYLCVADKHDILPCRLTPLSAVELETAKSRGGWADAVFWPQSLRRMTFFTDCDKNVRFHFASRSKQYSLVRLGKQKATP